MWLALFKECVAADPERVAIVTPQVTLTYRELLGRARERGPELLQRNARLRPRCLIVSADPLTVVEHVIGAWLVGLVPTVCHESLPDVALEEYRRMFERRAAADGATAAHCAWPATGGEDESGGTQPESEGLILTTSGSMGTPKLVVLPHRSLLQNVTGILPAIRAAGEVRQLVTTPVSRGTGLNSGVLIGLAAGWSVHLFSPRTPPPILQTHIRAHKITLFHATPSFFRLFFAYWNGNPFESVVSVAAGAEAFSAGLLEQLRKGFPAAEIIGPYGMTEAGTRICQPVITEDGVRRGAIGKPLPQWEWKIVPVPEIPEPAGELWLKGWTLFLGYLEEDGSYSGLDQEGYFHTGDLVAPDGEGGLLYKGRAGGFVRIGGYSANPIEVEQVIRALPGVQEAHVFAVEHPVMGRVLKAKVVLLPGAELDGKRIKRACAIRLEPYKVPHQVEVVEEVANPALGKVSRDPGGPG